MILPILCVIAMVLALNALGDGLKRDALEAARLDPGDGEAAQPGGVLGAEAGADAAAVLVPSPVQTMVRAVLESSIGLLLSQSKFPAFQISIQHTETRQYFGNGPNCGKSAMASLHGENGWRKR